VYKVGGYRLRAKKVKIHQLRAVVSWDIHWVYINYAQRLLSTFSKLILIARSGHLVSTLLHMRNAGDIAYRATHLQIQTRRYQPSTFLKKRVLLLQ
ncbi:hypothetical protein C0J52_18724, partial [Blattella germanica]